MSEERESRERSAGKSVTEIILMPLAVVLVGIIGTVGVTTYQTRSAEKVAAAERDSAERRSRSEAQLNALSNFSRMIASENPRERELALKLLGIVDVELASQLAGVVADDKNETQSVRNEARRVTATTQGYAFPVVGAFKALNVAVALARKLRGAGIQYPSEVYLAENNYYAVTLGGYLQVEEALRRTEFARQRGIAKDAYVSSSRNWGDNLFK